VASPPDKPSPPPGPPAGPAAPTPGTPVGTGSSSSAAAASTGSATTPPGDATTKGAAADCPEDPCVHVPWQVLAVALAWLIFLIASFVCYERIDGFADFVAFKLGRLPFESIWFGAAGGWLISAQGIFRYNNEWRRSYDYWHYVRPVLGALIGTLGCLVFIVLNDAATKKHVATNAVFYDVIALAIGYREESFRQLIAKVFDTIILPGEKKEEAKETKASGQLSGTETPTTQAGNTQDPGSGSSGSGAPPQASK
jgi:hypothetical protein